MNKTAIVIGATGLVGREVVNQLVTAEHIDKVITITRRLLEHPSEKVDNYEVDFAALDNYPHLFKGDILFSCLGTTLKQAGSIEAQRAVDLGYQYRAAELAAEQGVEHYLLVSSSGANSKSRNAYLKMKGELESRVRKLPFKHISIFQPSLLLGHRREARMVEGIGSLILPTLCKFPGLKRYRPISGAEVAAKMVQMSLRPNRAYEKFTLDQVFPEQAH